MLIELINPSFCILDETNSFDVWSSFHGNSVILRNKPGDGLVLWNPAICGHLGDLVCKVSCIERCPQFRGKYKSYLGHSKASSIQMHSHIRGVFKEGFHCTTYISN